MAIDFKALRAQFKPGDRVEWVSTQGEPHEGVVVAVLEPDEGFCKVDKRHRPVLDERVEWTEPEARNWLKRFDGWISERGGVVVKVERYGARGQRLKPALYQPYVNKLTKVED